MGRIPEKKILFSFFFLKAIGFMFLNGLKIVLEVSVGKNCFNVTWFYVINKYIKKWGK